MATIHTKYHSLLLLFLQTIVGLELKPLISDLDSCGIFSLVTTTGGEDYLVGN